MHNNLPNEHRDVTAAHRSRRDPAAFENIDRDYGIGDILLLLYYEKI